MPKIMIISGRGRYEDPWHDHAATSASVAQVLSELGHTTVRGSFVDNLVALDDVDLLIVNCGAGRSDADFDGDDDAWGAAHEAVRDFAASGRGILALHQAANTFSDSPYWATILGGRWIPGHSMHPTISATTIRVDSKAHPITADLATIEVFDERYSYLQVNSDVQQLAWHTHEGRDHPLVWINEAHGGRTIYDAMGHGVESYDSPERCQLLRQEAAWLLAPH